MGYGENNRASRGYLVDLLSQKGLQVGSGFEASPRFSVSCQGCGIKGLFPEEVVYAVLGGYRNQVIRQQCSNDPRIKCQQ